MRTPNEISKGIRRIFQEGNVPSSNRIQQDINKAVIAFRTVFQHQGRMVPGLANRSGHRNHAAGKNKSGWGGLRVTNQLYEESCRWLHPHAQSVRMIRNKDMIDRLKLKYENRDGSGSETDEE